MIKINTFVAIPILIASMIVGSWFLKEHKKNKALGIPWYKSFLTPPGIIILIAISIPIVLKVFGLT